MVLDHLYSYIPGMPEWFSLVGRIAAPIFFYFIVEGFTYTRSRKRYLGRLYGWATIMLIGSFILTNIFPSEYGLHNISSYLWL